MPHKLPYKEYLSNKLPRQAGRLLNRLYPEDEPRRRAFLEALLAANAKAPAIFWLGERPAEIPFAHTKLTDWQPEWVDVLTDPAESPSRHSYYYEGAYYPLDFSSVTTASALLAIDQPVERVLDVCSAPGGKALFAWRALKPQELICNEIIGKRHRSLNGNLKRCKVEATITQMDPARLAQEYGGICDVVMVDAPCSGQSLLARGQEAPGAFQDHLINMNMTRQRRIIGYTLRCVAPGGYFFYSTCTYSYEENEKNIKWALRRFPEFKAIEIPHLAKHRSTLSDIPCYRIEPQQGSGAGGFVALLKKEE